MYSEEDLNRHLEHAIRKAVPNAVNKFCSEVAQSLSELTNDIRDHVIADAAERGEITEDGELTGATLVAMNAVDHVAQHFINHLLNSKIQVVTSKEELEFHKSLGTFTKVIKEEESNDAD